MITIGNFFFHYRNGLFPLVYLLLLVPSAPLLSDYRIAWLIGVGIALAGQSLRAITIGLDYIKRGGKNRRIYAEHLVQGGLFAHCRNPLYVGNWTIICGVAVASNSLLFVCCSIPFFTFAYAAIIAAEENYLRKMFGQEFDAYCARVNRILPNCSGIGATLHGMRFNWRRLISKEYGSTFLWTVAVVLIALRNIWLVGEYATNSKVVWIIWGMFAALILAYGVARYLKKAGLLQDKAAATPH